MKAYQKRIYFLLASFLLALFILSDARILFFMLNKSKFVGITAIDFIKTLFYGLRFDVVAALVFNVLFVFLVALPVSFFHLKKFRITLKVVFISANLIALVLNMIDMVYFPFTLKRSTAEIFGFFFQRNDAGALLPLFLKEFWYLFVLFILFWILINWLYKIIENKFLPPFTKEENTPKSITLKSINFIFIIGLSILGIRGGTQLIPINIIDAGNLVKPSYVPLVLNTPFCVVKSGVLYTLEEKK